MTTRPDIDETRARARRSLEALHGSADAAELAAARVLVEQLRNQRDYELMAELAEAVSRLDPQDVRNRRLYAQCLIETGKVTAAIDVLQQLARRLPRGHVEAPEVSGLLGRAWKQIFLDSGDKDSAGARLALRNAIRIYRAPYERAPAANTWHGVNLVALLTRARRLGLRVAPELDPRAIAARLVADLQARPRRQRDDWFLPTLAEASLGLGDWAATQRHVRRCIMSEDARAFHIASALRQFTEVWDLEHADEHGRALVDMLRARLLSLEGSELRLAPAEVERLRSQPGPQTRHLEAILGSTGTQTYRWWQTGVERAASVAAIRQKLGGRIGTGFLVRAGDLQREPEDELLVLTNFHVVNAQGSHNGLQPQEAEVVFEAVDSGAVHEVREIVWSSPVEHHDASLLRLEGSVTGVRPLPIARALPVLDDEPRVYIIGHPGGREMAFSFQDNTLIDHEGPAAGRPPIPNVWRVHYRAPTEGGSSGSPVFNSRLWEVIALHHSGGRDGMPRLNGKPGTYAANEGIALQSIIAAMRA